MTTSGRRCRVLTSSEPAKATLWSCPEDSLSSRCIVIRDADTDVAYIKDSATPMVPVSPQEDDKANCGPGKGSHSGDNSDAARKSREEVKQFFTDYLSPGKYACSESQKQTNSRSKNWTLLWHKVFSKVVKKKPTLSGLNASCGTRSGR